MSDPPRRSWIIRPACWLLPAAMFVLALGGEGEVRGSTIAAADPSHGDDEHARYCKCRNCSGESCCCGPRESEEAARPAYRSATPTSSTGAGPCLRSAPCRDSGLPSGTSAVPFGHVAALALGGAICPARGRRLSPPSSFLNLPERRASRIDKPPEPRAA